MIDYINSKNLQDKTKEKIQRFRNLYPELFVLQKRQRNKLVKKALYQNIQDGFCKPYSYFKSIIDSWETEKI